MELSELPQPALLALMRHVPLKHRVGSSTCCALVCRSWAEAAAAATSTIALENCRDTHSLQQWLARHGAGVTYILIELSKDKLAGLPSQQLQDLHLKSCALDCSQLFSDLAATTKLSTLRLSSVSMDCHVQQLVSLVTALPSLEQLSLRSLQDRTDHFADVPCGQLQQLPLLTFLELGARFTASGLEHLSSLTNLQHLYMLGDGHSDVEAALQQMQSLSRLTSLVLEGLWVNIAPTTLPGLSKLSALQHLELCTHGGLEAPALAGLTQLQHLRLSNVSIKDAAALLSVLGTFQQLTQLQLSEHVHALEGAPLAAYSALTASSKLHHLRLEFVFFHSQQQPAWGQLFGPSKQLSQLTQLSLQFAQPPLGCQDLEQLVQACSVIQDLDLKHATAAGESLTALLRLSGLTRLGLGVPQELREHTDVISQLPTLRHLDISSSQATDADLQQLTALQRLEHLKFFKTQLSAHLNEALAELPGSELILKIWCITNTAPAGDPPDVWSQLQAACGQI